MLDSPKLMKYDKAVIGRAFQKRGKALPVARRDGEPAGDPGRDIGSVSPVGRDLAAVLGFSNVFQIGVERTAGGHTDDKVLSLLQTMMAVGRLVDSAFQQSCIIVQASSDSCGASVVFGLPGRVFRSTTCSRNVFWAR